MRAIVSFVCWTLCQLMPFATKAQTHPPENARAVWSLLRTSSLHSKWSGAEWRIRLDELENDTIVAFSSPYGGRANDACSNLVWKFSTRKKVDQYREHHCQEPPIDELRPMGHRLRVGVLKQFGRIYLTFSQKRLTIASYEVIGLVENSPQLVTGGPHELHLKRLSP